MTSTDVEAIIEQARQAAADLVRLAEPVARDYGVRPGEEHDEVADLYRSRVFTTGIWNPPRRQEAQEALEFGRNAQAEIASIAKWPAVAATGGTARVDPDVLERLRALTIESERRAERLRG